MTVVSKKLYINQLDKIVNKYSNTYQRTIKIKLADAKPNTYSEDGVMLYQIRIVSMVLSIMKKIKTLKLVIM